jgi:putative iron-only hydrogenase system regulator
MTKNTIEDKRIAVVGIILNSREEAAKIVNGILGDFAHIIVGRMGIPYKEKGISIISLIIDANNSEIGALTGRLGNLKSVKTKVSYLI